MEIKGTIARMHVTPNERSNDCKVIIMLTGDKTVYEGVTVANTKEQKNLMLLSVAGDEISFEYTQDFNDYVSEFQNHTLQEMTA